MGPGALDDSQGNYTANGSGGQTLGEMVDSFERSVLENALQACQGSIKDTMVYLGLARKTLYDKMKKYGLDKAQFKDDSGTE
jgi:two-component system C4-dicarboxylate transport response regulator DctD